MSATADAPKPIGRGARAKDPFGRLLRLVHAMLVPRIGRGAEPRPYRLLRMRVLQVIAEGQALPNHQIVSRVQRVLRSSDREVREMTATLERNGYIKAVNGRDYSLTLAGTRERAQLDRRRRIGKKRGQ